MYSKLFLSITLFTSVTILPAAGNSPEGAPRKPRYQQVPGVIFSIERGSSAANSSADEAPESVMGLSAMPQKFYSSISLMSQSQKPPMHPTRSAKPASRVFKTNPDSPRYYDTGTPGDADFEFGPATAPAAFGRKN